MAKSITKLEDAYLLPEKFLLTVEEQVQPDGTIMSIPHYRDIMAVESEHLTIVLFQDKDGRWMTIEYDIDGAYKTLAGF